MTLPSDPAELAARLARLPGLEPVRRALAAEPAFLVGGAVRDLLLGATRTDLDIAVEGDAIALARSLGAEPATHERFATASLEVDGVQVDLARTRSETYERPGALPRVAPAPLENDLARRDFTINAMAIPLAGEPALIDPHGGRADLEAGLVRVLHDDSFRDDPTRALRAARYCARLSFGLEPHTATLLAGADLNAVSNDRLQAELRRAAREESPLDVFALLAEWGLAGVDPQAPERIRGALAVLSLPGWEGVAERTEVVLRMAVFDPELARTASQLTSANPKRPSGAVDLARDRRPVELVAARAAGAAWLDEYVRNWRHVTLEISGRDLLAAGVPEGPAVGRGLGVALRAKLDGEASGREQELRVALEAARGQGG